MPRINNLVVLGSTATAFSLCEMQFNTEHQSVVIVLVLECMFSDGYFR